MRRVDLVTVTVVSALVAVFALAVIAVSSRLLPAAVLDPLARVLTPLTSLARVEFTPYGRWVVGSGGLVATAVAGGLLWLEGRPPRRAPSTAVVLRTAGLKAELTQRAVASLAALAAEHEGGRGPRVRLAAGRGRRFDVHCDVEAPSIESLTSFGVAVRDTVRRELRAQGVPLGEVRVRVDGVTEL